MIEQRILALGLAVLALAGCANDPAPVEQLRLTEQAVAQARAVGASAEQSPDMKLAEEKLARAQKNMGEQDYKRARIFAEQAELDARLAESKVLTEKSKAQLADLSARINRLRKQLGNCNEPSHRPRQPPAGPGLLAGCASPQRAEDSLEAARARFQQVKEDPDVLRSAPKDVIRAGESLARAERLSNYLGNDQDVEHYAYLSQRYSEIASQHSELNLNQERAAKLQMDQERLQLALREAKLLSVQQQGDWMEEQMVSLAATETDRGLVMTLGDVLFDTGRAELKASANRTLLKLVQFLQINPRRVVRIEGYTDSSGAREEPRPVPRSCAGGGRRARRPRHRCQAHGSGGLRRSLPVAENASSHGRAQNRRVEIVFSDEKGKLGERR